MNQCNCFLAAPMTNSASSKKAKSSIETDKAKVSVQERAEELLSSLDPKFPSFIKLMLPSHVSGGFRLGLPVQFCLNLPKTDEVMTLLDEDGEEHRVKYLSAKQGLSGGWKAFAVAHKLVLGDALVFHLVEPTKFKVYIVRSYGLSKVDDAPSLLKSDGLAKRSDPDNDVMKTTREPAKKRRKLRRVAVLKGDDRYNGHPLLDSKNSANCNEDEVHSAVSNSKNVIEFGNIKSLENFSIASNGLIIDSEISEEVRTKYYNLCCSQNSFLHEKLLQGLNSNLVAGIISETVNLADLIKACKLTTSQDEFTKWEKSLRAFKELGMNVDFLVSRLEKLANLASDAEQSVDLEKYREALIERTRVEEEYKTLVRKLGELKDASKELEKEIKTLEAKVEEHDLKFQAAVNAPW